jgi:hypothetical protein
VLDFGSVNGAPRGAAEEVEINPVSEAGEAGAQIVGQPPNAGGQPREPQARVGCTDSLGVI